MRFLHTADWHLGRLFHGRHLTDDQAVVLDRLVDVACDSGVTAVVVAGDVYDRPVPPPEAVEVCGDALSRLALDLGLDVIVIAGNHDSPRRLGFAAKLLTSSRVHVFGSLTPDGGCVTLGDDAGPICFHAVPYADPATVRACFGDAAADVFDHDAGLGCCLGPARDRLARGGRHVVIAHAFVAGGTTGESVNSLSVGGVETVNLARFAGFHYAALGHLHRPQSFDGGRVRYSGSLMKYAFDEADHAKSVSIIDLAADGSVAVEAVPLTPPRQVRTVTGTLAELLERRDEASDDYVEIVLTDEDAVHNPMERVRRAFPNALSVERDRDRRDRLGDTADEPIRIDHAKLDDLELFRRFFREVEKTPPTPGQEAAFAAVVEDLRRRDREVEIR